MEIVAFSSVLVVAFFFCAKRSWVPRWQHVLVLNICYLEFVRAFVLADGTTVEFIELEHRA